MHYFTVPFQHLPKGNKESMKTWITGTNTVGGGFTFTNVNPPHSRVDIAYRKVLHVQREDGQH